eukprot:TRINITY_DN5377_c0_g1_i5.p1 TRINITY_DN5377_c0_g1~~TRINITY_DN5377_c0_g1_i5.p1  ORF type:complete len:318 (-),score=83.91 TRINITY_DN5377_c0_g1_i5:33-848(-)
MTSAILPVVVDPVDEDIDFLATLNKTTFSYYFKPILEELIHTFVLLLDDDETPAENVLGGMSECSRIFTNLISLSKRFPDNRMVLSCSIRQGRLFIEKIVKKMSFLEQNFRRCQDQVIEILRSIQTGTRIMQIICAHGKKICDTSISTNVPFVKRAMESFIYHVKAVFKNNGMLAAFYQGNLKNKSLDGTEILSQENESDAGEADMEQGDEEEDEEEEEEKRIEKKKKVKKEKAEKKKKPKVKKEKKSKKQAKRRSAIVDGQVSQNNYDFF